MSPVKVGTCGYSYKDWQGVLYPAGTPAAAYLDHYARAFGFVELDFSYYTWPRPGQLAALAARVPPHFGFVLKAHRSLTHERLESVELLAARQQEAARDLAAAGRLDGLLWQFPQSFAYAPAERRWLDALLRAWQETGGGQLFLEFRHKDWDQPRVWDECERRGCVWVSTDAPDLPALPRRRLRLSAGAVYLRFHGRNAEAWYSGDNASRYEWAYTEDELEPWAEALDRLPAQTRGWAAFNNHRRGLAVEGARWLSARLARSACGADGADRPGPPDPGEPRRQEPENGSPPRPDRRR